MEINFLLNSLKTNPSEHLESEIIEFKNYSNESALHNAKDLTEEISAIANKNGGRIIVGIIDSSEIKNNNWIQQLNGFQKIDIDTTKERLLGKIFPKIDLRLEEVEYELKNYLVIYIPKVNYSLVSTSSGKVCIRIGKSSYPANPEQIESMVKNLQTYDWSSEDIDCDILTMINPVSLIEAKIDFCKRRGIELTDISDLVFLESIGATKNGILNKGGLLFLGKKESIVERLGLFEYRFSWKTNDGQLKINDVWNDCIWNSIKRSKKHFDSCNQSMNITYEENQYTLFTLDKQAFHEAYLNSIVHRDYSTDGMSIVNFKGNEIIITNPGSFYGGVNSENISYHEPRHRNKTLAKILMDFQLVDRAGMGVLRMGLNSLKYGREFPKFKENLANIEVIMAAEYFKAGVFVLTQKFIPNCGLTELFILNSLFKTGSVNLNMLENDISKIVQNTWKSIEYVLEREEFKKFFILKGDNNGVYVCPLESIQNFFEIRKPFKASTNSDKHILLYRFLKQYQSASNEEIMNHLGFASPASTYQFLIKLKYVENTGKSRKSRWRLKVSKLNTRVS